MLRLSTPGYLRFGQAKQYDATFGGGEANVAVSLANGTYATDYLAYNIGGSNGFGENIAQNYSSTTNLMNAWMDSPGHRGAILNSIWNYGVMACYYCNGSYYWVNLFKI